MWGIVFTVVLSGLTLMAAYMNLESWPARIVWVLILAALLIFNPTGYLVLGPLACLIALSAYQSYKNHVEAKAEEE